MVCRLVWSVVSLSRVSFAESRAFGEERARLRARCSWVSVSMLLGVRRGSLWRYTNSRRLGIFGAAVA